MSVPVDITMCEGGDCPQRERCYRYRGIPVGRQDWLGHPPWDALTGTCAWFWDVALLEPTPEQIRDRAYHLWLAAGRPEGQAEAHWLQAEAEARQGVRERLRDMDDAGRGPERVLDC